MLFGTGELVLALPPKPITINARNYKIKGIWQEKNKIGLAIDGTQKVLELRTYLALKLDIINLSSEEVIRLAKAYHNSTHFYTKLATDGPAYSVLCFLSSLKPYYLHNSIYHDAWNITISSQNPIEINKLIKR